MAPEPTKKSNRPTGYRIGDPFREVFRERGDVVRHAIASGWGVSVQGGYRLVVLAPLDFAALEIVAGVETTDDQCLYCCRMPVVADERIPLLPIPVPL